MSNNNTDKKELLNSLKVIHNITKIFNLRGFETKNKWRKHIQCGVLLCLIFSSCLAIIQYSLKMMSFQKYTPRELIKLYFPPLIFSSSLFSIVFIQILLTNYKYTKNIEKVIQNIEKCDRMLYVNKTAYYGKFKKWNNIKMVAFQVISLYLVSKILFRRNC